MLSRRVFLKNGWASAGFLLLGGCRSATEKSSENAQPEAAGKAINTAKEKTVAFALPPQIPRLIFFPECKPPSNRALPYCKEKNVRPIAMEAADTSANNVENLDIKVLFSNGQNKTFKGNAVSYYRTKSNGKRAIQREGVLLKSLISFTLESLFNTLRNAKYGDSRNAARKDFLRLQEMGYLESIPIGSVYLLASEMGRRTSIRSVTFDQQQRRFIIG